MSTQTNPRLHIFRASPDCDCCEVPLVDLDHTLAVVRDRLNGGIATLDSAIDYIAQKGQVKPGWTAADHDAYWMLKKRSEELRHMVGEQFTPQATGAHMEHIL